MEGSNLRRLRSRRSSRGDGEEVLGTEQPFVSRVHKSRSELTHEGREKLGRGSDALSRFQIERPSEHDHHPYLAWKLWRIRGHSGSRLNRRQVRRRVLQLSYLQLLLDCTRRRVAAKE
jgi:hypothetical protein